MYARMFDDKPYEFGVLGAIKGMLTLYDKQTNSRWSQLFGRAIEGPMEGHQLERLPSTMTTWEQWRQLHPQTTVYVKPKAYYRRFATDHFEYIAQAASGPVQVDDLVLGLEGHAQARAYLLRRLAQQRLVQDTFEDAPILVYLSADLSTVRVFNREVEGQTLQFALTEDENLRDQETSSLWHPVTGESIQGPHKGKKLTGLIARYAVWFAWHSYRPDTHIHGE